MTRVKIVIVGSGPAGLSAASRAAALGLDHIVLEKTDHLSDTIYKYQRGKHVMATPAQLALRSDLAFEAGKREIVLSTWGDQAAPVSIRNNAEVVAIEGAAGAFTLKLADGDAIEGETIVLAIGTQGNPNRMRVPGGDLPHIQYQLDDPEEYVDEFITVVGGGDAGIENALGLAADPAQGNKVILVNREAEFARAKPANVALLMAASEEKRITILPSTSPASVETGWIVFDTRDGERRERCDRVIARMGSTPPRPFLEGLGIAFTGPDREAFPQLSPIFETSVPGIHIIGALAGYPLIKHCMNQGYDVVEFIAGNRTLKPADEPILAARLKPLGMDVDEGLEFLRSRVSILNEMTPLQMREFMLDSTIVRAKAGEIVFAKHAIGSSLFGIAEGSVKVLTKDGEAARIACGSIVGEVGLISGRRRGATVRAASDAILVEVPRAAALKLMALVPPARRAIERITTERQILQIFGAGLTSDDIAELIETAEVKSVRAGEAVVVEGEADSDVFVVRSGSMIVEKNIGGKPVFMSYLPAGAYFGEMALIDGLPRNATVRAAIRSEVVRLDGAAFARLLDAKPALLAYARREMAARHEINAFVEASKDGFDDVIDLHSSVARFLVDNGIGEATDVLLIDERLCVGCDNCEKACADSHEGLSRLDREAGRTFAHLHVPTSCRHCEHPHCMADCPPNAITRGADGEVKIDDTCIGCGNCVRNCPYGVIRLDRAPPKKPSLASWLLFGAGPGPGQPPAKWSKKREPAEPAAKKAIKCDMCAGIDGGPACVRACPTGAAIRVAPEAFLTVKRLDRTGG